MRTTGARAARRPEGSAVANGVRRLGWCLLATALPAVGLAHHAILAKFDDAVPLTLSGIVTKVDWRNPHAHIFMNVEREGDLANWAVELPSPIDLQRAGWRADTLRPGDAITVEGMRARDGSRQIWGDSVQLSHNGRRVLYDKDAAPVKPLEARPTPRWPDGQPTLGRLPGMADGYWDFPSAGALIEDGVDVAMGPDGLLENIDDAERVAPMQPWALALYRHRQERALQDDPTFLNCKPTGGVRHLQTSPGVKFIEDRPGQRIFVLVGSGNRNYRIIHLDGRAHVGQVRGDDDNPLYYGRSVGEWDGDTLVVDTRGFNEDFWFTSGGLPHTEQLRLIERFSRPDHDTMHYEVTIEDPGAYTRSWTSSWTLRWVGGEDMPVHFCQHNRS